MSVVKSWQSDEDLKVLTYAEELLGYTFDICHREKTVKEGDKKHKEPVFPQRYWSCFTSKIIQLASEAYDDLFYANEIRLDRNTTPELFAERRDNQLRALAKLRSMYPKITFAWHRFSIETNSIEYWSLLIGRTIAQAERWASSDVSRFNNRNKT